MHLLFRVKNRINLFLLIFSSIFISNLAQPAIFTQNSTVLDSGRVVDVYGQLKVEGNKITDKNGNAVILRGMSLFWSQWMPQFYNYDCIKWLRDDWKCNVIRASMAIGAGGYLTNPATEKAKIKKVIEACINLGIYVIIDWHEEQAQTHTAQSIAFFKEIAAQYGDKPNVIYEIFNEPNGPTWSVIKLYADSVVSNIRSVDPDNLVIVGTPTWSQDVDVASKNPLQFNNIVYTLHFYAATHKQTYRDKAATALKNGIALFVSEWGTCESSGNGILDSMEVEKWAAFMDTNKLSWCNWAIEDKNETAAALKSGASGTGGWTEANLSKSGSLVRGKLVKYSEITSVNDIAPLPLSFELYQNYPNPFNPQTKIEYEINNDGHVKLEIFDINGRHITTLINSYESKGKHFALWHGNTDAGLKASSGVYFFNLEFKNQKLIKKGVLLN